VRKHLLAAAFGAGLACGAVGADTVYVSTVGHDHWSGRLDAPALDGRDGPFATLERAQRALRELGGGEVVLRAGLYELMAPLVLKAEDSGKAWFSHRLSRCCWRRGAH